MKQIYIIVTESIYSIIRLRLYFLTVILFFASCGVKSNIDKKLKSNKKRVFYYSSGKERQSYNYFLRHLDTIKVDNEILYFHDYKIKEIRYYNSKGEKDSIQTFYENGNKESFLKYKNNLKHGKSINRLPSGNIESVINYKKGLLDGESKGYYDTGRNGVHVKNYFKEGRRYLHQYEYDSTGNLETYIFADPITSEVVYSSFYKSDTFLFGNGLKAPLVVSRKAVLENKINKDSLFSCKVFTISPPLVDLKFYYKIGMLNDKWVSIKKESEYAPYVIQHKFDKEGIYRLQLKFILKYPNSIKLDERTTNLDLRVVN